MSSKRVAAKERVDFDEKASIEITTTDDVEIFTSFDSLGLKEDLLRGIYAYGIMREIKYYLYLKLCRVSIILIHYSFNYQVSRDHPQFSSVLLNRLFRAVISLHSLSPELGRLLSSQSEYCKFLIPLQTKPKPSLYLLRESLQSRHRK